MVPPVPASRVRLYCRTKLAVIDILEFISMINGFSVESTSPVQLENLKLDSGMAVMVTSVPWSNVWLPGDGLVVPPF